MLRNSVGAKQPKLAHSQKDIHASVASNQLGRLAMMFAAGAKGSRPRPRAQQMLKVRRKFRRRAAPMQQQHLRKEQCRPQVTLLVS